MAMIVCSECRQSISDKAKKCPHCGAPVKKRTSIATIAIAVIVFAVVGTAFFDDADDAPTMSKPAVDASTETQAKRKKIIDRIINEGVFFKVEQVATLPHAYTGRRWNALNVDEKKDFSNVTLTYYYAQDKKADMLVIHDGKTGEQIGTFGYLNGLDLD